MEFCKDCRNILYITSTPSSLTKECKHCNNVEEITSTSAIKLSETQYTNDDLLFETHLSKYLRHDPTLQRVVDPDINNGKPTIYIKYNPIEFKYMYVCEETGRIWRN
tara:strand:- start:2154 stop:2474 length:321 start_codon:yes stop_codon:yes gene_type:complete